MLLRHLILIVCCRQPDRGESPSEIWHTRAEPLVMLLRVLLLQSRTALRQRIRAPQCPATQLDNGLQNSPLLFSTWSTCATPISVMRHCPWARRMAQQLTAHGLYSTLCFSGIGTRCSLDADYTVGSQLGWLHCMAWAQHLGAWQPGSLVNAVLCSSKSLFPVWLVGLESVAPRQSCQPQ